MSQIITRQATQAPTHQALAPHYNSHAQQFQTAKLGMWLFLATEVMMFGGLFCLYAVFRANRPELFEWGHHFLSTGLGAINTVILLLSSFTMAWAVRASQLRDRRLLLVLLLLTLLGGFGFMGIKYVEYTHKLSHGIVPGAGFDPAPRIIAETFGLSEDQLVMVGDPVQIKAGAAKFGTTCVTCHGPSGGGVLNLGPTLVASPFVGSQNPEQLVEFLKVGRRANDPKSVMQREMPARGGNSALTDEDLGSIAAFVLYLTSNRGPAPGGQQDPAVAAKIRRASPPADARLFFSIYYLMTGLHGLHVLIGMALITWLIACTFCDDFATGPITRVDLIGLYWHLVDLIWIFLFPLLYLID